MPVWTFVMPTSGAMSTLIHGTVALPDAEIKAHEDPYERSRIITDVQRAPSLLTKVSSLLIDSARERPLPRSLVAVNPVEVHGWTGIHSREPRQ